MPRYRNTGSVYELVDVTEEICFKARKCAVCGLHVYRNDHYWYASYAQLGGVLIQKKSFHNYHYPPKIYRAGKGFDKE